MADTLPSSLIRDARTELADDAGSIKEVMKYVLLLLEDAANKRDEIYTMTRENLECTRDVRRDLEELKKRVDSIESNKVAKLEEANLHLEQANSELVSRISSLEESYNFAFKKLPRIIGTVVAVISVVSGIVFGALELVKDKQIVSSPGIQNTINK